jgi:vacuolar iron transporter family protein
MTDSDNKRLLTALDVNWQAEMEGHYAYSALAKKEDRKCIRPSRRSAGRTKPVNGWSLCQESVQ